MMLRWLAVLTLFSIAHAVINDVHWTLGNATGFTVVAGQYLNYSLDSSAQFDNGKSLILDGTSAVAVLQPPEDPNVSGNYFITVSVWAKWNGAGSPYDWQAAVATWNDAYQTFTIGCQSGTWAVKWWFSGQAISDVPCTNEWTKLTFRYDNFEGFLFVNGINSAAGIDGMITNNAYSMLLGGEFVTSSSLEKSSFFTGELHDLDWVSTYYPRTSDEAILQSFLDDCGSDLCTACDGFGPGSCRSCYPPHYLSGVECIANCSEGSVLQGRDCVCGHWYQGNCLSDCPDHTYLDTPSQTCLDCPNEFYNVVDNVCVCPLFNGPDCVGSCPMGWDGSSGVCVCELFANGVCVGSCPDSTFQVGNVCQAAVTLTWPFFTSTSACSATVPSWYTYDCTVSPNPSSSSDAVIAIQKRSLYLDNSVDRVNNAPPSLSAQWPLYLSAPTYYAVTAWVNLLNSNSFISDSSVVSNPNYWSLGCYSQTWGAQLYANGGSTLFSSTHQCTSNEWVFLAVEYLADSLVGNFYVNGLLVSEQLVFGVSLNDPGTQTINFGDGVAFRGYIRDVRYYAQQGVDFNALYDSTDCLDPDCASCSASPENCVNCPSGIIHGPLCLPSGGINQYSVSYPLTSDSKCVKGGSGTAPAPGCDIVLPPTDAAHFQHGHLQLQTTASSSMPHGLWFNISYYSTFGDGQPRYAWDTVSVNYPFVEPSFTATVRVRPTSTTSRNVQAVISTFNSFTGNSSPGVTPLKGWAIVCTENQVWAAQYAQNNALQTIASTAPCTFDVWTTLSIILSDNKIAFYVNSEFAGADVAASTIPQSPAIFAKLRLGSDLPGHNVFVGDRRFFGFVRDVNYFSYILSPDDISSLVNSCVDSLCASCSVAPQTVSYLLPPLVCNECQSGYTMFTTGKAYATSYSQPQDSVCSDAFSVTWPLRSDFACTSTGVLPIDCQLPYQPYGSTSVVENVYFQDNVLNFDAPGNRLNPVSAILEEEPSEDRAFTAMVWVLYEEAGIAGRQSPLSSRPSADGEGYGGWAFYCNPNDVWSVVWADSLTGSASFTSLPNTTVLVSTVPCKTPAWTHLALSYGNGQGSFYINGEFAGTATGVSSGSLWLSFGSDATGVDSVDLGDNFWTGAISDVRYVHDTLSQTAIYSTLQLATPCRAAGCESGVCAVSGLGSELDITCQVACPAACPVGTGTNGPTTCDPMTGELLCVPCLSATFNDGTTTNCRQCSSSCPTGSGANYPGGRFCSAVADVQCVTCPDNTYNSNNALTCSSCVCQTGYGVNAPSGVQCTYNTPPTCKVCGTGTYNLGGTSQFCVACNTTCPAGTGSNAPGGLACSRNNNVECATCLDSYNFGDRLTCIACRTTCPVHHGTNTVGGLPCTLTAQAICGVCASGTDNDGTSLVCSSPSSLAGIDGAAVGGGIAGGAVVLAVAGFICVRRRRQKRASLAQVTERLAPENEMTTPQGPAIVVDTTAAVVPLAVAPPDSPQPAVTLHTNSIVGPETADPTVPKTGVDI